jgi:hypothetical protein
MLVLRCLQFGRTSRAAAWSVMGVRQACNCTRTEGRLGPTPVDHPAIPVSDAHSFFVQHPISVHVTWLTARQFKEAHRFGDTCLLRSDAYG